MSSPALPADESELHEPPAREGAPAPSTEPAARTTTAEEAENNDQSSKPPVPTFAVDAPRGVGTPQTQGSDTAARSAAPADAPPPGLSWWTWVATHLSSALVYGATD